MDQSPESFEFQGSWRILFLGPVHPADLQPFIEQEILAWFTLGLYNAVVAGKGAKGHGVIRRLQSWAREQRISTECWSVCNGAVLSAPEMNGQAQGDRIWKKKLADCLAELSPDALDAIEEFRALMASSLSRAEIQLNEESPLRRHLEWMAAELAGYIPAEDSQAVAALTEINAALSRLSSQAFSGASPISETECHFWTHSLLGIGVPILALVNITRFLHRTLAEARLVQRFNAFKKVGPEDWLGIANPSDPKWSQAHLEKAILDPTEKSKALTPTAPYFSGRDGFKATEYTISAPLGAISSCSSEKWTLRPLTHEAVHPVVGGILTAALPNTANRNEAERIIELLNDRRSARNQFESIQALLIHLFDDLDKGLHEDFSKGRDKTDQVWTLDEVSELIFRLKHEVEETMVHAFDYLYFFRGEPKAYVHSVWNSLDSIPSLSRKVPQFVMRTTAAISIPFLDRRRQPEAQAKSTMIALLKSIGARTGAEESYRSQALAYLSEEWTQRKQDELVARIWIANFVRAFLYLPTLDRQIAEIHRGPSRRLRSRTTAGAAATKVVYSHRPMHLDARDPITDPVGFAAFHARGKPEPAHSAWILTMLAFNAAQNHGPTS